MADTITLFAKEQLGDLMTELEEEKRTGVPRSKAGVTGVTERTSSMSASISAARSIARPGSRTMSPNGAKKSSSRGIFSSATRRIRRFQVAVTSQHRVRCAPAARRRAGRTRSGPG